MIASSSVHLPSLDYLLPAHFWKWPRKFSEWFFHRSSCLQGSGELFRADRRDGAAASWSHDSTAIYRTYSVAESAILRGHITMMWCRAFHPCVKFPCFYKIFACSICGIRNEMKQAHWLLLQREFRFMYVSCRPKFIADHYVGSENKTENGQ